MPSFRKSKNQAKRIISKIFKPGSKTKNSSTSKRISSLGTARSYQSSLAIYSEWLKYNGYGHGIERSPEHLMIEYLSERQEYVSQSTLDLDRQALMVLPNSEKLPRYITKNSSKGHGNSSRNYTNYQHLAVSKYQSYKNNLATRISYSSGLRAHELLTLNRPNLQPTTKERNWSKDKFLGREGIIFTVKGKGGLVREILLPEDLAKELESNRLSKPILIKDRGINYKSFYNLGGGQAWSQSFSHESNRQLGWSKGAHGLRHSYAQNRMLELKTLGFIYKDSLTIVSQELGHFRPDITEVYLR